ncbi:MAG: glycosyltransferase [Thermoflexales bacterium]
MTAVSLIFTVLNEAQTIPALLDSIAAQTRKPDEVIVCDGGSRDATVQLLRAERRFPLLVIEAPGANIARGRNLAIEAARHPVVACTDAGVRLHPRWLEHITAPFEHPRPPHAVAGFFVSDPCTPFEVAMGATVLPMADEIHVARFMPSSRSVAFQREAWQAVGGYPEWLDYCEDVVFDIALRARFGEFVFAPEAIVYFRPRSSLGAFFRQYYLYARGDGKANLFFWRHVVRYSTYLLLLPALLSGAASGNPALQLLSLVLLVMGSAAYTHSPYRRLQRQWHNLQYSERIQAALLVPLIRLVGDIAKMAGYPAGVAWRLQHNLAKSGRCIDAKTER